MSKPALLFDGTPQGMFDTVVSHLFTQGRPALDPVDTSLEGSCAYRGKGGLKCAVGCLIPDERYDEVLEGSTAYNKHVCAAIGIRQDDPISDLAWHLQQAHDKPINRNADGTFDRVKLRGMLREVALQFNLNTAALPQLEVVS